MVNKPSLADQSAERPMDSMHEANGKKTFSGDGTLANSRYRKYDSLMRWVSTLILMIQGFPAGNRTNFVAIEIGPQNHSKRLTVPW